MRDPLKDADREVLVPDVWRPTLAAIVDSLVRRDAIIGGGTEGVDPTPYETSQLCLQAVAGYGDVTLTPLPPESWDTSVALWSGDRWRCLIDLWTEQEGRSDLALDVDVFEDSRGYRFSIHLVYVP